MDACIEAMRMEVANMEDGGWRMWDAYRGGWVVVTVDGASIREDTNGHCYGPVGCPCRDFLCAVTRVSDRCHRLKHPLSSTTDHTPSFHRPPYEHADDPFCIQEGSRNCPGPNRRENLGTRSPSTDKVMSFELGLLVSPLVLSSPPPPPLTTEPSRRSPSLGGSLRSWRVPLAAARP